MEQLLKQVLENQLTMNSQFMKLEDGFEELRNDNKILKEQYEKLDTKLTNFITETRNNFSVIREKLSANLDDISYIFREYDSRFAKMK